MGERDTAAKLARGLAADNHKLHKELEQLKCQMAAVTGSGMHEQDQHREKIANENDNCASGILLPRTEDIVEVCHRLAAHGHRIGDLGTAVSSTEPGKLQGSALLEELQIMSTSLVKDGHLLGAL